MNFGGITKSIFNVFYLRSDIAPHSGKSGAPRSRDRGAFNEQIYEGKEPFGQ